MQTYAACVIVDIFFSVKRPCWETYFTEAPSFFNQPSLRPIVYECIVYSVWVYSVWVYERMIDSVSCIVYEYIVYGVLVNEHMSV